MWRQIRYSLHLFLVFSGLFSVFLENLAKSHSRLLQVAASQEAMVSYTVDATKVSWGGRRYARILCLSSGQLLTLDPADCRVTNSFALSDVIAAEHIGSEILIHIASGCDLCGILRRELRFTFNSIAQAYAAAAAVRARLVRHLTQEASDAARSVAQEAGVLSAAPREQLSPMSPSVTAAPTPPSTPPLVAVAAPSNAFTPSLSPTPRQRSLGSSSEDAASDAGTSVSGGGDERFTFDVTVSIQKARGLPPPPPPPPWRR